MGSVLDTESEIVRAELIGRSVERTRIAGVIERARHGRGGALVLRGEPGIGKTSLVMNTIDRTSDFETVLVRGFESEVELAGAGIGELMSALRAHVDRLPRAQAEALRSVHRSGTTQVDSPYVIFSAVQSLLTAAAEVRPLLVVADDFHWLDPLSRDALAFVGRRLGDDALALLLTVRSHEPGVGDMFGGLAVADITRLSVAESRRVVTAAAVDVDVDVAPGVADELARASGGNPLVGRELVASLTAAQLRGDSQLPDPLAADRALQALLSSRVDRLEPATRVVLLVAALSADAHFAAVGRAVAAVEGLSGTTAGLEPAVAAGLVRVEQGRVEFSHPLLRTAIVEASDPLLRRLVYQALAATAEPEMQIFYQAEVADRPDAVIASGLVAAATRARQAAGHVTAARRMLRAAELTPPGRLRTERMLGGMLDARLSGRLDLVRTCIQRVYAESEDPLHRADAEAEYARALMWAGSIDQATPLFMAALSRVRGVDDRRAVGVLLELVALHTMAARPDVAIRHAVEAAGLASVADIRASQPFWSNLAYGKILDGDIAGGVRLLDEAHHDLFRPDGVDRLGPLGFVGQSYIWAERFGTAGEILDRVIDTARRTGAATALPNAMAMRSHLAWSTGTWTLGAADAAEAARLARDMGHIGVQSFALACLGLILAGRGDRAALSTMAEAERVGLAGGVNCIAVYADAARGLLALAEGDVVAAVEHLDDVATAVDPMGLVSPLTVPWRADHIEALVRSGQRGRALARLAELDGVAERTGLVWPAAVAQRCRGLLSSGDESDHHFAAAMALHERIEMPFERARTALCWAGKVRRRRHPGAVRRHLLAALGTFERLRARPWADQARAALAVIGAAAPEAAAVVPGLDDLSAQELQVVLAAARGMSNPEIAGSLFLARKTIEHHLSLAYRKLRVRSRTELAALIARATAENP